LYGRDEPVSEFEEFVAEHYRDVLRTVALAIGNRTRAEDAVQEAFLKAFRKWRTVRTMTRPETWVLVVAVNAERRSWRRAPLVASVDVDAAPVRDHAGPVTTAVALRDVLAQLTARQRTAVVLRYLADLPVAEIATALDCAEGTVKATLHQALAKLRIEPTDGDL
jgi:RNA polymerase sigma-70 factor (ECF subfamily)